MIKYLIVLLLWGISPEVQPYILALHNQERVRYSMPKLEIDEGLNKAAQEHADWMAARNRLTHQSLGKFMGRWSTAGENIAMGQRSEEEVVRTWIASSGHRANILNKRYTHVGFGLSKSNNGNLYWCTVFTGR